MCHFIFCLCAFIWYFIEADHTKVKWLVRLQIAGKQRALKSSICLFTKHLTAQFVLLRCRNLPSVKHVSGSNRHVLRIQTLFWKSNYSFKTEDTLINYCLPFLCSSLLIASRDLDTQTPAESEDLQTSALDSSSLRVFLGSLEAEMKGNKWLVLSTERGRDGDGGRYYFLATQCFIWHDESMWKSEEGKDERRRERVKVTQKEN